MASFTETVESINPALVGTGLAIEGSILRLFVVISTLGLPIVVGTGQGWGTWWWICVAGMVLFIPTIFIAKGYWSISKARKGVHDDEAVVSVTIEPTIG